MQGSAPAKAWARITAGDDTGVTQRAEVPWGGERALIGLVGQNTLTWSSSG